MAKEKEYERLPGQYMGFGIVVASNSRVWLGKDHLLRTDVRWFTEEYKRFYFRDIQAIIIRKTGTGKVINIIFGVLTLLPLLAAILTSGGLSIFWWIVAGFFGLILLINTLWGPTCVSHMRTAVQTEELPSLRRLRRANKVLARLRPLIAAAQGELPAAEIPARMEQLVHPAAATFPASPVAPSIIETAPQAPPEASQAG